MHIIAEQLEGHWSAWVKSDPATAFGGRDAREAVKRLCSQLGLDVRCLAPEWQGCHAGRMEFVYGKVCPDCRGSGRYVGLNTADDCASCDGTGRMSLT